MKIEKPVLVGLIVAVLAIGIIGVTALTPGNDKSSKHTSSIQVDDTKEVPDAEESAQLNNLAKITKEEAENIALKNVQGLVKDSDLENEDGNVIYTVDIIKDNMETEVKIDAVNGDVLNIERDDNKDNENDDNNEKDSSDDEAD